MSSVAIIFSSHDNGACMPGSSFVTKDAQAVKIFDWAAGAAALRMAYTASSSFCSRRSRRKMAA
jgi:hypothetical protein